MAILSRVNVKIGDYREVMRWHTVSNDRSNSFSILVNAGGLSERERAGQVLQG